ncbi:DEAD/DEAH box helicase family protein [Candidatus Binatia bacterium]|nr:DEAD/DEAH box helicase family protein [Candidatus Binatia bacterium]
MAQVVIENPILNSPFEEPKRHFRFDDEGITDEIVDERRISSYFIPIAQPKKKGRKQLAFDTEWTKDRIEENKEINRVRQRVSMWRAGGYVGVTPTTSALLQYWRNPERERKLFFCQIEALETAIYITEVAKKYGDAWIENHIRSANDSSNPGLPRMALKMATGSGKTVVMAMLIAWHTLNKLADPQNAHFSDAFLIVTPGITIRDRLRVLLPNDPNNYYRQRDIVPGYVLEKLGRASILITNFHAFRPREKVQAGKLTKSILARGGNGAFTETQDQMVRRVCRELGSKKNIVVINDEAHHCYRRKPDGEEITLKGDERKEAAKRDEEARVWISGLEAVKRKIGVKVIHDLSATPFFLRGSGYPEGTLFPWVVSDFSLIDAIECGIVKVPRVPVADDSVVGEQPTYRDLWLRIRDHLPRKGRGTEAVGGEPKLPAELEGALHSLYGNYEKYFALWKKNDDAQAKGLTPPVFIVVCNNTNVSKLVFDYVAGWEKQIKGKTVVVPGRLPIFSNEKNGGWSARPNSILVDSAQLESGDAMSADFKKMAAREIDEFKAEYRVRFPGRDAEALTDEDLLREVMNTVGKAGKLGEDVKCVVSVSMLTEGWDANTVTHILGVRAFGTQLLCEQVVGRALRRMSYAPAPQSISYAGQTATFEGFPPEYAEVYGVPFSFIPCSGSQKEPRPGPLPTRVRALEDRSQCEIAFPRLLGYRYDVGEERIEARFTDDSKLALTTADLPTKTELDPIVGEKSVHTLDELRQRRENEVAFVVTRRTLEKYFRDDDGGEKPWLFPQLLRIAKRWIEECLTCKDNTFPQLLLLAEFSHDAADRIYKSVVTATNGAPAVKPILRTYDTVGSTRYVDFDTTRNVYSTRPDKCHVSHVVADTGSWEQKLAESLEDMDEVVRYVKNHNLGFTIPYSFNGEEHQYHPDFVACIDDGHGRADLLHLLIEVTGEKKKDKAAKVTTARTLWVPAVNNHGGFGRWAFLEVVDPWSAKAIIRSAVRKERSAV